MFFWISAMIYDKKLVPCLDCSTGQQSAKTAVLVSCQSQSSALHGQDISLACSLKSSSGGVFVLRCSFAKNYIIWSSLSMLTQTLGLHVPWLGSSARVSGFDHSRFSLFQVSHLLAILIWSLCNLKLVDSKLFICRKCKKETSPNFYLKWWWGGG